MSLDVDARFLLANERTLLAWVRTSLTLLAGGLGTLQLLDKRWRDIPGFGLLVLGAAAALVGLLRYRQADRSIRTGQLPPSGHGPAVLAVAVACVGAALVAISALSGLG